MRRNRGLESPGVALVALAMLTLLLVPSGWAASKYKTLHRFTGADGAEPTGDLISDGVGNLYGTTTAGGAALGWGAAFKMTQNADGSWTESVLHSFTNGADGGVPGAGLIFDGTGNLYGTTTQGGAFGWGTVFKLAPNSDGTWTETVLYSFCSLTNCPDGAYPIAGLVFDGAGNLYGTASYGGISGIFGTVFKLAPNSDGSWTESVLYSFCSVTNCADGEQPSGSESLVFDRAGNLYGTTPEGGGGGPNCSGGCGTVYELTPNSDGSWTESVLYRFAGLADGAFPYAGLIFDPAGNLYGATTGGGNHSCDCGVVFKLTPNSDGRWKESVLHTFKSEPAANPDNGLTFDAAGNLYGSAAFGTPGGGAVFKLAPKSDGSWAYSVLHAFLGKPALHPVSRPLLDKSGNLYGTTQQCGSACQGVVFELTP
jgi:uncharacterized repeat protein (TIGR03803 family)